MNEKDDERVRKTTLLRQTILELEESYERYKNDRDRQRLEMIETINQLMREVRQLTDGERLMYCSICDSNVQSGQYGVYGCGHGSCLRCNERL